MSSTPSSFSLPFLHKKQLAKNTYSFFFDRSGIDFDFLPGQYIRMILPHEEPDDRGTSRFFTIASSPLQKDTLQITAKVIQSSFKETLLNLKTGQAVIFFGPMGNFYLQENSTPHVFLSGGMGITPFHSMLLYASEKKLTIPLTLISAFGSGDELIFYDELIPLSENNKNIQVIYTVTHNTIDHQWLGETGRISEELLRKYIATLDSAFYYVVGPASMVEDTKKLLTSLEINEDQIMSEDFTGY